MAWKPETIEQKSKEFAEIAKQFQGLKTTELVNRYIDERRQKETIEESLKPINERLNVLISMLAERFDEEELKSLKLDSGELITVSQRSSFRITDHDLFVQWLKDTNMDAELTVSAARVTTIAAEYLKEEKRLPPGIEANQPVPKISLRKS